ncbi:MAG TPA: tetratricopeptide repeat protein [Methylomirabilota bacterium]|nr:tetratricopeptide repeat protein [Methylomirabilota bacterium]
MTRTPTRLFGWTLLLVGALAFGGEGVGRAEALPLTPELPQVEGQLPLKLAGAALAMREGNTSRAYDLALSFVKDDPTSAPGQDFLGAVALARGNLAGADAAFAEALKLEPARATAVVGQGRVALARGNAARAEALFRRAMQMEPRLLDARWSLATALLRQRQVPQAVAVLQESIQYTQGADQTARYMMAGIAYELGKLGEAERLLTAMESTESPGPPVLLAIIKYEQNQPVVGKALLEQVVARDRQSPSARLADAMLQREAGQLPPARRTLEQLASEQPQWAIAHFQLALTLLRQRQKDAALRAFEKGEAVSTDRDMATVRTAQALLAAGEADLAVTKVRAAMASSTAGGPARALLIQATARAGKPDAAERDLKAVVTARRDDPSPLLDLGRYYLGRRRPKDALPQFQAAARLSPSAVEPVAGQVQSYLALGQAAQATGVVDEAIKQQPRNPDLQIMLASIQERQGNLAGAEAGYRKALELEPKHLLAARALASLYERSRRGPEAVKILEEASQAHPTVAAPLVDLGIMQARAGDSTAAIATFRQAVERDPSNLAVLNNLAFLLSGNPATLDEAHRLAQVAYAGAPGSPSAADTLGWILFLKGDLAGAERLLSQAQAAEPNNPQIHYHLGKLYAKQGKKQEARTHLEAALKAGAFPESRDAQATLQLLK